MDEERERRFEELCREAAACRRCPAMAGRRRVLSAANGRPGALVLFVGEAPGRRGGERTGVPFSGDQSGRNFTALLAVAGLTRAEVFVTNAVLCNPRDGRDRNRPPSRAELAACRDFLARQLALVAPPIVAPMGAVALAALDALVPHGLRLAAAAGHVYAWDGRLLAPLYHPGPRAQLHRPFARQAEDFARLGRLAGLVRAAGILQAGPEARGNLSASPDVARLDVAAGRSREGWCA